MGVDTHIKMLWIKQDITKEQKEKFEKLLDSLVENIDIIEYWEDHYGQLYGI